jgi:hypothetical protein
MRIWEPGDEAALVQSVMKIYNTDIKGYIDHGRNNRPVVSEFAIAFFP